MQNSSLPRVHLLESQLAERIAAGEVIERPSSVVKELVENALDAGATEIQVLLEDGGKSLIEVTDNGHGIHPEDLAICVQRHATSKISKLDDLEKLKTLGFRGEALPSISAASDLAILSRIEKNDSAFLWENHSAIRPMSFGHFLNSHSGTRIQARGLFSQIPARLKFLKSQSAEVSHVREWLERLALSHPSVGFRLVSNDRTLLNLRTSDEISRVSAILSEGESYPIISDQNEQVRIHWVQGLSSPNARKLIQVVNGRVVRDRLLQQALLLPFKQALLPGQFPALALFLEIDPSQIDVNVHPTKTEVRFLESRKVFQAVETLVAKIIAKNGSTAFVPMQITASENISSNFFQSFHTASVESPRDINQRQEIETKSNFFNEQTPFESPIKKSHPLENGRLAGMLFNTYLLYDLGREIALVDQHAADERIRYEKLKKRALALSSESSALSQKLLLSEAVKFPEESRLKLEKRLPWLQTLGFEAEIFSENTLLFRSIPAEWGMDSLRTRLKNLVDRLLDFGETAKFNEASISALAFDEALFESLASEACHSAVRAGDRLETLEATQLVDSLFDCEHPWNCPHGRPTIVRITRAKLEEWFHRRI